MRRVAIDASPARTPHAAGSGGAIINAPAASSPCPPTRCTASPPIRFRTAAVGARVCRQGPCGRAGAAAHCGRHHAGRGAARRPAPRRRARLAPAYLARSAHAARCRVRATMPDGVTGGARARRRPRARARRWRASCAARAGRLLTATSANPSGAPASADPGRWSPGRWVDGVALLLDAGTDAGRAAVDDRRRPARAWLGWCAPARLPWDEVQACLGHA